MAHWFQHYGAGIAEGIIASVLFAVAIAFTRVLAEKAKARRYRVAGWYLTRFTYLRRDESSGAITEYTDDDSKALLHLKQRGLRFHGMIQTPQSRATFSCRGRITDTYQLYGRYRENRRRAAYQVFFHVPRLRGDNPAREFKGMWCGYSAVEDRLTSGFDAWRELLRVRVIQVTADKMSPDVDRILKRAPRRYGSQVPAALADGLPRVIYLAKYKDHAVGAAVIERIMPTTPATIRAAAKTAGCGNPATEPCHVIRYVYVDSFARKRGVASQLVRHCVDSLRKEGSSLCVAVAHEDEAKEVAGALTVNGFSPLEMRETRKDKAAHLRIFISHYPELAPNWAIMDPIHLQIQYMREFFKRV